MTTGEQHIYRLIQDGSHFQENSFLSATELRVLLSLYVDDFVFCRWFLVCNPLGSSHRLWVICLLVHIHHCSKFTLPSYAKLLIWTSMVMTGFYVHFSKVLVTPLGLVLTDRQSRVVQHIKELAPLAFSMHCFLHREAFTTKEF